jgi:hypothetical protein
MKNKLARAAPGLKINEAGVEVVDPKAMLARIVDEVQHESRRRKGPEAESDRQLADEAKRHAADLLAKLGAALDSEMARDITAVVNALLVSTFVVGSKRRHHRMAAVTAKARHDRGLQRQPYETARLAAYKGAIADIVKCGEEATIDRIRKVMGESHSVSVSRSVVKELRRIYGKWPTLK